MAAEVLNLLFCNLVKKSLVIRSFFGLFMLLAFVQISSAGIFSEEVITSSFTMATGAQDGYILTTDIDGKGSWKANISSEVIKADILSSTNTWTAQNTWVGSATFLNSDFSVGISTLVVKAGSVGIGTSNPSQMLEVKGYSLVTGPVWGAGNQAIMYMGDNNHYIKSIFGNGVRIGSYLSVDAISILESNGGIGFWTTTPNEAVTINGRLSLVETTTSTVSSGFGKVYTKSSDSQLWFMDDAGKEALLSYEYAVYQDSKTANTVGGTASVGAWQTRTLTGAVDSKGSSITRSGNTITLSAGTYKIRASAPAFRVGAHKIRLRNSGNTITLLEGSSEYAHNGVQGHSTRSVVDGIIITSGVSFIIQHYTAASGGGTSGLGYPVNQGAEVYTQISIEKIR